ncbi:hypothetical protein EX30DRAFT_368174 [Ascodesmis nigricans]|uniref:Alanine--tRNA ligase n=1 Tax=Ascodesmis nigricans TaxID=341454 RepID=A0A4S2N6U6_9PEZI|nr:hypothetical protein EX30DRAFT_368174 [Ascodesmis nigricans]
MASSSKFTVPSVNLDNLPTTPEAWNADTVRATFLSYFQSKRGHTFVPSSSVVPHNDPTLLFANAGMNQYKPIFLGTVDPQSEMATWKRAANSQKCIRAGGKHNDLDDVGKDSYHHTFFEMLGNWSFGDYFKKEAIEWSWELLTKVYGIPGDRLYVTYFEGDASQGLEADEEAKKLWSAVGVPEDHILPGNMKDNFWEMGDQGPCGPCSEIHYDRIGGRNAAHLVNMDDPDVLEIWNNVFIQFNREEDRSLRLLPNKHVDTGMGFERLVSVLQDKRSNYDTDVFHPLFDAIQNITGAPPYAGKFGEEDKEGIDTAYRVVADHVRMLSFAIADGATPGPVSRGYVVRRVLRRGARYARRYFGVTLGEFFGKLVPTLVKQMGQMFPELVAAEADIIRTFNDEEEAFAKALDRGEKLFNGFAEKAKKGSGVLDGLDVWRLYDTFGFPTDLTRIMAEEAKLTIDEAGFEKAREEALEASKRRVAKGGVEVIKLDVHDIGKLESMSEVPMTDDSSKYDRSKQAITAQIRAIYHNKEFVSSTRGISSDDQIGILMDKTNFYAEQGGQEYDTGSISIDGKAEFEVQNVQAYAGYILHTGFMKYGSLSVNDEVISEYDELRRSPIRNNHTGTHVLNWALREALGDSIHQKGSLVAAEKLRFDFSHDGPVSAENLEKVEESSTKYIRQNLDVYAKDVPLEEAKKINGVRAVFGETYPDPVRVVSIGVEVDELLKNPNNEAWENVSVEFCGGTHVGNTQDIKDLVIVEESGIAKGIRRIIAVTGVDAHRLQQIAIEFGGRLDKIDKLPFGPYKETEMKKIGKELKELKTSTVMKNNLIKKFDAMQKELLALQKAQEKKDTAAATETIAAAFEKNPDAKALVIPLPITANPKALSGVMKTLPKKYKDKSVYLFAGGKDGQEFLHAAFVSGPLGQATTAQKWTESVSSIVGGKAGGKGPTSQGVATNADKLNEGIEEARRFLEGLQI